MKYWKSHKTNILLVRKELKDLATKEETLLIVLAEIEHIVPTRVH